MKYKTFINLKKPYKSDESNCAKKYSSIRTSNGFTLIEVVLVLAIGGLIFLLAFLAFQQVSANRRDTQRRSDARRMIAMIEEFSTNSPSRTYPCSERTFPLEEGFSNRATATTYFSYCNGVRSMLENDDSFNVPSAQHSGYFGYNDPSGDNQYIIVSNKNQGLSDHWLWVHIGTKCENGVVATVNSRSAWSVRVKLEKGGTYCVSNT